MNTYHAPKPMPTPAQVIESEKRRFANNTVAVMEHVRTCLEDGRFKPYEFHLLSQTHHVYMVHIRYTHTYHDIEKVKLALISSGWIVEEFDSNYTNSEEDIGGMYVIACLK